MVASTLRLRPQPQLQVDHHRRLTIIVKQKRQLRRAALRRYCSAVPHCRHITQQVIRYLENNSTLFLDAASGQQVGSQELQVASIEAVSESTPQATLPQTLATVTPLSAPTPNKTNFHTHSTSTEAPTPPPRLAPVFSSIPTSIMVDENDGDLELATLEAHYPDEQPGPITYIMKSGDPNLFSVSSYTGKLILLKVSI